MTLLNRAWRGVKVIHGIRSQDRGCYYLRGGVMIRRGTRRINFLKFIKWSMVACAYNPSNSGGEQWRIKSSRSSLLTSEFDVSLIFRGLSQKTKSKLTKSYSPTLGIITFSAVALRSDLTTLAATIQLCRVIEQHLRQHERPEAMVNSVVTAWVTKPGKGVIYFLPATSKNQDNLRISKEISHILTPHRNSSNTQAS